MTRKEFLQQLEQALAGLTPEAVREILADYEEYFNDALADGRDEAEVVAALGSPQKLARELKAQTHYRQWEQHRSFANLSRVIVSLAGLGVLNLFLALPFMLYLIFLTVGYMVSVSFLIGGLAVVVGWGSHTLFGWPSINLISYEDHARHERTVSDFDSELFVEDGRLRLEPDAGTVIRLTTRHGEGISVRREADGLKIDSSSPDAAQLVQRVDDSQVSINRSAVAGIVFRHADGDVKLNFDANGELQVLDAKQGGRQAKVTASGASREIRLQDGADSLVINNREISARSGGDGLSITALPGMTLTASMLVSGVGLLLAGALGLLFCVWLTRLTWRGLVAYVKYQIALVSGSDRDGRGA
ncbi:hypothetical protein CEK28_16130 [Xenophilus sp. AP218F]|nr:DUF1700 domain-containing protein [Chromobacterium sp. ASV5]OWY37557.1 hypothetical protein CEK28_16130 [Xenophilus sp. AP218F]